MDLKSEIIFPNKLIPGDVIAITAPSSGVPSHLHARLDMAIRNIERRGYRVLEGNCLRSQHKNKSADKTARAAELMTFLTNPEIKAIMPPWGGDLGMELLELMDFEQLRECEPKWFVGFSDLTTFQFPLTTLTGWATLHGPNLMDLGAETLDATTQAIWCILESDRGIAVQQHASVAFQIEENQWGTNTCAGFNLTQQTEWKALNIASYDACFQGRLLGGCLDIISRLAGTQFGNLPLFHANHCDEGIILYFENVEMGPCELTRALLSLRLQGWFTDLQGVLIGRSAGPNTSDASKHTYIDALRAVLGDLTVPVLYDVDIGHIPPQISLVNGAMAKVEFRAGCGSVIQQL
ncbi:S66 peptidase family protein [Serratia sp. M24T3]|uniref:S66 family peptidase n=1 Tax=Serratia sp. M24T3 TaxID=932213 RepID=UPI00025BBAA6|nr:S66 peptidase family protein [Serratia sp. M24T3]EIC83129.1 peptidase U61 LD-carboxypeptidase A [Serratia sp. M24T3]EMC6869731.1 LD-carboxypeptidase [Salmonella enterica]